MKLFIPEKNYVIRLQILKQGEQAEYINLSETTMDEVEEFLRVVITDNVEISPFQNGRVTAINIRESLGGKNGVSRTISFKGLNPKETHDLIIKNLEQ